MESKTIYGDIEIFQGFFSHVINSSGHLISGAGGVVSQNLLSSTGIFAGRTRSRK